MPYSTAGTTSSSGGYSGYYSGYNPSSPVLSSSNSRRTNLYSTTTNNSVFDRLSPNNNNRTQSTSGHTRTGASSRFSGATGSTFNNNISSSSPSSSPTQRVSSASVTKRSNLLGGGGGGNTLRAGNNNNNNGQKNSSNAILANLRGSGMNSTATSNPTLPLSHTIGRVQDRNKLGLIEKDNYGHSPLLGTTSTSTTSASPMSATPSRAKTIDYLTVGGGASTSTPSGYTQHTPSRGLFSPNTAAAQQQQQQNQTTISSSSASQESSFLLPSTGVSPGVNSNRASSPLARSSENSSPQNLISDLFHPLPANQYKPSHPNHHHSHLLPELEAMTKRMKSTIRLPAAVTPLDNNHNVDTYTTVNTNPLTSSSSSPAKSTTMNNNNNNKFVKSPSTEDLTEEIASKNNNNTASGATAGAFGKPYDRNDLVTTPPQHFSNGTNIFHHTIVFDLDETLCHNRGPGRAVLRPGAVELLRELAAIKRQLKQEHDKLLQQVSSVVTNYNGGSSSINNNNNNKMNPNIRSLEIVLWTASMDDVAEPVIRRLDPNGDVFDHLIFRDSRWFRNESNYTKDLRLLGRDFGGIVIVENSPVSVRLNRQNSILVKDFVGQSYNDNDLFAVKEVLLNWISGNEKHFTPIDRFLKNCPSLMDPKTNYVKATAGISTSNNNTFSLGGSKYSNHHAAGGIRW